MNILLFILALASTSSPIPSPAGRPPVFRHVIRETALRVAPETDAEIVDIIHRGEILEVRDCDAGWCAVGHFDNMRYVQEKDLGPTVELRTPKVEIQCSDCTSQRFPKLPRPLPVLTRALPDIPQG